MGNGDFVFTQRGFGVSIYSHDSWLRPPKPVTFPSNMWHLPQVSHICRRIDDFGLHQVPIDVFYHLIGLLSEVSAMSVFGYDVRQVIGNRGMLFVAQVMGYGTTYTFAGHSTNKCTRRIESKHYKDKHITLIISRFTPPHQSYKCLQLGCTSQNHWWRSAMWCTSFSMGVSSCGRVAWACRNSACAVINVLMDCNDNKLFIGFIALMSLLCVDSC
jgi:hypothetical protein